MREKTRAQIDLCGDDLQYFCHRAAVSGGWWPGSVDPEEVDVPLKLMLCVSELAEAMEGHRKGLMDDKLPHRSMLEVELADAVIRIFDLAGALGFSLGGAMAEKMAYNETRVDHTAEARELPGGKKY